MGAPAALALLLIGNSLSAANDLPAMLEAMGKASGVPIRCTIVAKPNFSLEDHWKDGDRHARAAIARAGWSHVIMQQGPSALPESRLLLHEYARQLNGEIRRARARPAMLAVWPAAARRADFDRVAESYRSAADLIDGDLFPVGEAWRAAWARDSALPLYRIRRLSSFAARVVPRGTGHLRRTDGTAARRHGCARAVRSPGRDLPRRRPRRDSRSYRSLTSRDPGRVARHVTSAPRQIMAVDLGK